MKRKIVCRLLAGFLTVSLLVPSAAMAASLPASEQGMTEGQQQTGGDTSEEEGVLPAAAEQPEAEAQAEEPPAARTQARVAAGWQESGGRRWYRHSDGGYTRSDWEKIDGSWYYFDASGWALTGWQKINGSWYYMDAAGKMLTGWQRVNGSWYYMDGSGRMLTGWQKIGGSWYYLNGSGQMLTGWQWINGKCYYMDASGVMASDTWIGTYYVDGSGAWIQGKTKEEQKAGWVKSQNRWWYRHGDGSYTRSGWEKIDGSWYYFDGSGWMLTGWQLVGGSWYYMDASGRMLTGWQKIGGSWYYLNASGRMLTGWQWINGKCYYMNASGVMASDTWIGTYYVDGSGAWVQGKTNAGWVKSQNRWWYRHGDGSYTRSGWEKIDGSWYYFDGSGWMLTGWQMVGGSWYYLDGSGRMLTGWQKIGGSWYYLEGSGRMLTGWQKIGTKSYYMNASGVMASDTWIGEYYVDASGAWVEGKKKDEGNAQIAGWKQSGGRWYYVNADGSTSKSKWQTIDGKEYYFDKDGWMVKGWLETGGNWYYLKEDGSKAYSYWVGKTGVGGYYISKYGTMVAGTTDSQSYYIYTFDNNGLCIGREDRYVRKQDPLNEKFYQLEKQFETDPQVGTDVTEDEFLAAAVYAEAGNQGMPGMTGVAMVMLNRMDSKSYPSSANFMIYENQQFEVARNGSLTKFLKNINSSYLNDAKTAVAKAREIMKAYIQSNTPRTVEGLKMPEGKTDFNYMGFMTPKAFENAGLDWEKTEAFTYLNTTFYTTWIKKK